MIEPGVLFETDSDVLFVTNSRIVRSLLRRMSSIITTKSNNFLTEVRSWADHDMHAGSKIKESGTRGGPSLLE
ncbi:uncharacterized protein ARMOST_10697 [Armillaria ostoyae]|uniref:Uncharacterized protein n=1 Tax=Armillaria ostoyae TaxID=47428 RepID=A0A284RF03_ARMOS|nr:uncharacterized protein ARMOST_10697 [Armillaria ostoyae]